MASHSGPPAQLSGLKKREALHSLAGWVKLNLIQPLALSRLDSELLDCPISDLQWDLVLAKYLRPEVGVGPSRPFHPKEDQLPAAEEG